MWVWVRVRVRVWMRVVSEGEDEGEGATWIRRVLPSHRARKETRVLRPVAQLVMERLEHELIRRIVANAQDELERVGEAMGVEGEALRRDVNRTLGHHPLVDPFGARLDVALAHSDVHGEGSKDTLQMVLELTSLHRAKLRVGVLVVPRN